MRQLIFAYLESHTRDIFFLYNVCLKNFTADDLYEILGFGLVTEKYYTIFLFSTLLFFTISSFWDLNSLNILLQLSKNLHHCQNLNEKFSSRKTTACERWCKKGKENSLIQWTFLGAAVAKKKEGGSKNKNRMLVVCIISLAIQTPYRDVAITNAKLTMERTRKSIFFYDDDLSCSSLMYLCISH